MYVRHECESHITQANEKIIKVYVEMCIYALSHSIKNAQTNAVYFHAIKSCTCISQL